MANRWSTQFFATLEKKPFQLACNFIVDPTNGNGLGVRSLKGPGIANAYMHTTASFSGTTHTNTTIDGIGSTAGFLVGAKLSGTGIAAGTVITAILSATSIQVTPATTASATVTISYVDPGNPNPAAGIIVVQFQDNYNRYLFGTSGFVSPLSGSNISISTAASLTLGAAYVIVSVGTTTAAQWNTVGVPVGIIPAVGVSFIAKATAGTGTGVVQVPTKSGITDVEVIGDPNTTITSQAATVLGVTSGSYIMMQCLGATSSSVTTLIPTAPATGSVVGLSFFMSNSFITVQGQ